MKLHAFVPTRGTDGSKMNMSCVHRSPMLLHCPPKNTGRKESHPVHSLHEEDGNMTMYRHDARRQLFAGLLIISIGVLFLLDQFDVFSFGRAVRLLWPIMLIAIGVSKLIRRSSIRYIAPNGDHQNAQ